jgi:hypothetical protein
LEVVRPLTRELAHVEQHAVVYGTSGCSTCAKTTAGACRAHLPGCASTTPSAPTHRRDARCARSAVAVQWRVCVASFRAPSRRAHRQPPRMPTRARALARALWAREAARRARPAGVARAALGGARSSRGVARMRARSPPRRAAPPSKARHHLE